MATLVVTGGASGLGRATASLAVERGWTVVLVDRDELAVTAVASELGADSLAVDVADPAAVEAAFTEIAARHGGVDALVNAAGLTRAGKSEELAVEDWQLVIDVDLNGTYYCCRAVHPHLNAGGAIVNLASIASTRGLPGRAAYSAAKAGVVGLTRALAAEWAAHGVRVNAVGPSWVDTALVRGLIEDGAIDEQEVTGRVPAGRLGTPEEVAGTVLYLIDGDGASYVTGQTLYVDGGFVWAG